MAEDQDRELDRIRRWRYNGFDGARVVADLLAYHGLWTRAWMEWSGGPGSWDDPGWIPDSLVIQAADDDSASRLVEIGATWESDGIGASRSPQGEWTVHGWWD